MIRATLGRLASGENLSIDQMQRAVEDIMEGRLSDSEIALLLTGLRMKGETISEIAGAAAALRKYMTPIRTRVDGLLDTCGTGGDRSGTFNISTAAAIVTAAAGVPVAKHGNRSVTSRSGSADVLEALGVNIEAGVRCVETCLDELGICFCFAPLWHVSMRRVASVRQRLGVPTIFNLLGPLVNPAGATFQLIGVGAPEQRSQLAGALALLGTEHAVVVHGEDGLDEVTLNGSTHVSEVGGRRAEGESSQKPSPADVCEFLWRPEDFGLEPKSIDSLRVDSAEESAAVIRTVLDRKRGAARDIVVANAAAALWTVGKAETTRDAARLAAEAIDSGAAADLLARLVECSNR